MVKETAIMPADYVQWLAEIKNRVLSARQKAALAVNAELISLYWHIGRDILQRQAAQGWGSKVIDRLGRDLREAFPEMKGFSSRNLIYMRAFAEAWTDFEIVQQAVAQLPWGHNVLLLNRIKEQEARLFYVQKAIAENWSRTTLEIHIKNRLHERQGKAVTNFSARLPAPTSALAQETLKDPYLFDFLSLGEDAQEREIENALMQHITRFLLELGNGFAFVGRQYRLEVNGDEFFIDLLFYHTRLKCYVVVELKATAFKPEHAGQLNFYLAAVDAQVKAPDDHPTIGLLLCKTQNHLVAEYALSGIDKPIGIAEYELVRALPEPLVTNLPTVEQLENELSDWQENK
ncbi:PDDEXK nuclease domain-containing protein [Aggregatibacter kilianii]|uniref:PDDEXK nuclease domain-containing protein n=1 Tax=Aggregatibacter kilianii TaxID=2025884 RepID=UPI000D64F52B|nr:PDDEXK nuclease domain-containing protein [Aggregatibacter kilianii]